MATDPFHDHRVMLVSPIVADLVHYGGCFVDDIAWKREAEAFREAWLAAPRVHADEEHGPRGVVKRDPYGALAADEQAVKAALTAATVKRRVDELAHDARFALARAGIEGRTVRVVVEVTIPEGSGIEGAPLVIVRPA